MTEEKRSPGTAKAIAKRILIIGLDGATFDVFRPLMAEGYLPCLKRLVGDGASGLLRSTTPPITPAAWTTFLTGVQPGTHGIIDFERYDVDTNKLIFNSSQSVHHLRNLWNLLGEHGLKVGSINVPMTFPARKVNGFLISGFETPDTDSDFVYPPELRAELLSRWPDPISKTKWRRKAFGDTQLFRDNVDYMSNSFHQGAAMTRWLGDKYGWDVLMVVMKLVDNLQHKAWKYIDPRWSDADPVRRDIVRAAFGEMDKAVADLVEYAREKDAAVMLVSDHGHGSLEAKVQPNLLLRRWGYLTTRGGLSRAGTRVRHLWDRSRGRNRRFARAGSIEHDLALDFSRTRACVMHAGMAGFLYLNLLGRQPTGIVPPGEYEQLRNELCDRFLSAECRARTPEGRLVQMFTEVHKPEELWGCSRENQPWLPDLLLTPHESFAVVRKIRGRDPVRWLPYRRLEGTHRADGIFIAHGNGIVHSTSVRAQIGDCTPTVLAMLGLPVPNDMEGRVLNEIFESPPEVERVTMKPIETVEAEEEIYSEADLEKITERLSDLGYLE